MDIAVCIKQVPVSNDVSVDPETHALIRSSSEGMVNPADLNAIEAALLIKEQNGGRVVVFTMGPEAAEQSLRTALAMGCDESCLLADRAFAGGDTVATAKVLAEGIRKYGKFDLVLTGAQSADGATGQVGPMIAEYMGVPHIAEVSEVQYDTAMGESVEAVKKYQDMDVRIAAELPALMTVSYGCNTPRLPTLRSQRAAKEKPLETYSNDVLKMDAKEIGAEGSPTVVTDSFQPEQTRKATILSGSNAEIAGQIMEWINTEKGNS